VLHSDAVFGFQAVEGFQIVLLKFTVTGPGVFAVSLGSSAPPVHAQGVAGGTSGQLSRLAQRGVGA
jgi:hypothetical protein